MLITREDVEALPGFCARSVDGQALVAQLKVNAIDLIDLLRLPLWVGLRLFLAVGLAPLAVVEDCLRRARMRARGYGVSWESLCERKIPPVGRRDVIENELDDIAFAVFAAIMSPSVTPKGCWMSLESQVALREVEVARQVDDFIDLLSSYSHS